MDYWGKGADREGGEYEGSRQENWGGRGGGLEAGVGVGVKRNSIFVSVVVESIDNLLTAMRI